MRMLAVLTMLWRMGRWLLARAGIKQCVVQWYILPR